jgi:hypothetical protein
LGLIIVPILAVPAMVVGGITWRAAATWVRMTLVVGAIAFAYFMLHK